jgi:regulator of cell morphogenesis and NO signaling
MTDIASMDDPAELTRYIERHYHRRHRTQLPDLAAMAAKVEQVHAGAPAVPDGLAARLRKLIGELEVHMKKEELILFPAIRRGSSPGLGAPIAVMRADHGSHEDEIACLRGLTKGFTPPEGACGTWQRLYGGLREFVADLEEHIRLENEVLFPRFDH